MPTKSGKAFGVVFSGVAIALLVAVNTTWALSVFSPVPANQINQAERDKAQQIADALWSTWRSGKFEPLSDAFTSQMRQSMTPEVQQAAYGQTKEMFGDYKNLSFAQAVASPIMPGATVYRFRATFSGSAERPEIRVVMDKQGKVSGFWIKPWAEELQ
jgi:hypothetical protein